MRPLAPAIIGFVAVTTILSGTLTSPARSFSAPRSDMSRAVSSAQGRPAAPTVPPLRVTRMIRGLDLPWDVKPITRGRLLITERTSKRLLLWSPGGHLNRVRFPTSTVWTSGETGLMALAVDPAFSRNHRFYTCQGGHTSGGGHDVRVMSWQFRTRPLRATLVRRLLVGMPSASGMHGGCRLLIAANGALVVGTGDATVGTNPRNLSSLGGKTLRLSRFSGSPWPDNPFISSTTRNRRYVMTFGHRNVQGLAQRADGSLWSAEHGPDRDDEVNRLTTGGDYGWHPVPGYNQTVPMTDQNLPGTQVNARWRSGVPTVATSGITFVKGDRWSAYRGTLAVAALKGSRVMFMRFDAAGAFVGMRTPPALRQFGRLRSVTGLADGDLLVTTSNGGSHDAVLRVRPTT